MKLIKLIFIEKIFIEKENDSKNHFRVVKI